MILAQEKFNEVSEQIRDLRKNHEDLSAEVAVNDQEE